MERGLRRPSAPRPPQLPRTATEQDLRNWSHRGGLRGGRRSRDRVHRRHRLRSGPSPRDAGSRHYRTATRRCSIRHNHAGCSLNLVQRLRSNQLRRALSVRGPWHDGVYLTSSRTKISLTTGDGFGVEVGRETRKMAGTAYPPITLARGPTPDVRPLPAPSGVVSAPRNSQLCVST